MAEMSSPITQSSPGPPHYQYRALHENDRVKWTVKLVFNLAEKGITMCLL